MLIELQEIPGLDVEIDLVYQSPFEGLAGNRDLEYLGYSRKDAANLVNNVNVPLDVLLHMGMSDLYCHHLSLVHCFVHLPYRPSSNKFSVETVKYFFTCFAKLLFEDVLSDCP